MYDVDHPAYRKLSQIGREVTGKVKPRAVVVFSAHWQASRDTVQVNTAEMTELIYEYVCFSLLSYFVLPWEWSVGEVFADKSVSMASRIIIIKKSIRMWGVKRLHRRCLGRLGRLGSRRRV